MNKRMTLLYGALSVCAVIVSVFSPTVNAVEISDKVIAMVNDDVVTMSELITEGGQDVLGDPDSLLKNGMTVREARDIILEQIIMKKLLDQAVNKEGLGVTPVDVDRLIADRLKMDGMSKQDLLQMLAKEGKTYDEYRSEIAYSIKRERMISRRLSSHIIVTDEEIAAYFKEHSAEYKDRKEYRVSEIIFPIPSDATESIVVSIRNKADMVHGRLKSGASFDAMAREYSMAPDAESGGDMGFLDSKSLDPGFLTILGTMKIGQISDVIGTENGFIIFKVTDTRPIENITVDDVKPEIVSIIRREKTMTYFEQWMKDLRDSAFVDKLL